MENSFNLETRDIPNKNVGLFTRELIIWKVSLLLLTSCPIRLCTGCVHNEKMGQSKFRNKITNKIQKFNHTLLLLNVLDAKCLLPYCLYICSTNYMSSMENTLKLWWQTIIEFDAKYHRSNNSISDPNEHHPLVNVNVDRFLYMSRTIHHRRFVEIGVKSGQEH